MVLNFALLLSSFITATLSPSALSNASHSHVDIMAQRQPEEILHWHMVHAHKTFKAGFDSILSHLADPPFHDLSNFLGYCEAWAQSIDGHHDSEGAPNQSYQSSHTDIALRSEEVVFPFLNRKMDFSGEIGEHKVIHAALDEILAHITAAKADPSKFDAPKLKGMMEAFRTPLVRVASGVLCLILMYLSVVLASRRRGQACCSRQGQRLRRQGVARDGCRT